VDITALVDYLADLVIEDFERDDSIAPRALTADNDAHVHGRHLRSVFDGQAARIVDRWTRIPGNVSDCNGRKASGRPSNGLSCVSSTRRYGNQ
jgi:hypothetical protein